MSTMVSKAEAQILETRIASLIELLEKCNPARSLEQCKVPIRNQEALSKCGRDIASDQHLMSVKQCDSAAPSDHHLSPSSFAESSGMLS